DSEVDIRLRRVTIRPPASSASQPRRSAGSPRWRDRVLLPLRSPHEPASAGRIEPRAGESDSQRGLLRVDERCPSCPGLLGWPRSARIWSRLGSLFALPTLHGWTNNGRLDVVDQLPGGQIPRNDAGGDVPETLVVVAGVGAELSECAVHVQVGFLSDDPLRLLDHDTRLESGLQLGDQRSIVDTRAVLED